MFEIDRASRAGWGIEVDVRSDRGLLYASHDPIRHPGTVHCLEIILDYVRNRRIPTILDFKESGIAHLVDVTGVEDLVYATDLIYPDQKRLKDEGSRLKTLSRSSPHESISKADGYWWDYQFDVPASSILFDLARQTVIVSPELHGQPLTDAYVEWVKNTGFMGVCTDHPERYE